MLIVKILLFKLNSTMKLPTYMKGKGRTTFLKRQQDSKFLQLNL